MATSPGVIRLTFAAQAIRRLACLALCAAYIQGPVVKILDFDGAIAEMARFGLSPAPTFALAVIAFELVASALILFNRWRWLAALALAGLTFAATFIALRFWEIPAGQERVMAMNGFFEHLGLIGGFILVAIDDLAGARRAAHAQSARQLGRMTAGQQNSVGRQIWLPCRHLCRAILPKARKADQAEKRPLKQRVPFLLSFNGGYVDTVGFLALQGLFTAHVTGNFVTFGAAMVEETSGVFAKLLTLPVFCATIILARFIAVRLGAPAPTALKTMFAIKIVLLSVAAALALSWGPFPDGDSAEAIFAGMVLVCAMAIQNGAHRVHLAKTPPSTLMTGTTTQIMLDLADLLSGNASTPQHSDLRDRLRKMTPNVIAFAAGCGSAALVFISTGLLAFLLPPLVALAILISIYRESDIEIT